MSFLLWDFLKTIEMQAMFLICSSWGTQIEFKTRKIWPMSSTEDEAVNHVSNNTQKLMEAWNDFAS
jgi:hypothetical protein